MSAAAARLRTEGIAEPVRDRVRAAVLAERARRSGSRSFAAFVKQAWHIVDGAPLVWNWHLDVLCSHLEAVARGEIKRLVINIPPGFAKSLIVSVLWPAWMWTHRAGWQVICASYGADLAKRDAVKSRGLIEHPWYQDMFVKNAWTLREDQNTKGLYVNTAFGHRFSCGVKNGTGVRSDCVILDDPIKAQEAHSKAAREEAERFLSTASTRFNNAKDSAIVVIMQRLREDDTTGHVIKGGGYEHVMLPAECEEHRRSVTFHVVGGERKEFWRDPRANGELLFEEKFPKEELERLKRPNELGVFGYAGQMQQNPRPADDGFFKLADWRFWSSDQLTREKLGYGEHALRPRGCPSAEDSPARSIDFSKINEMLISVDGAGGAETKDGSFNSIHVWARFGSRRLLLYRIHRRMDTTDTVKALLAVIELFPYARRRLIEAKASGSSIISHLEKAHSITGLEPVNPGKQSKFERAMAMQPYHTGHNVELPEGAPWVEEYIAEHAAFPNGEHDDDVDAQSQGLQGLERGSSWADEWGASDDDPPEPPLV